MRYRSSTSIQPVRHYIMWRYIIYHVRNKDGTIAALNYYYYYFFSNPRSELTYFVCTLASGLPPYVRCLLCTSSSWQLTENYVGYANSFSMGNKKNMLRVLRELRFCFSCVQTSDSDNVYFTYKRKHSYKYVASTKLLI